MQKAVEGNGPYLKSKCKETLGQLHPYVPVSHSVGGGWRFVFVVKLIRLFPAQPDIANG
jgi:hypothetical protein